MYFIMLKRLDSDLQTLNDFLKTKTPEAWLNHAAANIPLLLLDHAHCERKAAGTAINFISKYPEKAELVAIMAPLAREELLHFEKVIDIMKQKGIVYSPLQPSDYASNLHKHVTNKDGIERLCDQLIIGAIIEARSCERFSSIIPYIEDQDLARFYKTLVKSECRHFEEYLHLAKFYGGSVDDRISEFLTIENAFILSDDVVFRFHSGLPPA
ncbi:TPA: tRNA-(ms[2]io[6]A)-hydroxylase [Legionella pneumophila]|uniref:tRNA-(Ms(2)io(6)a)-hydrolase(TRNA hydroxylase) n=4 Tax=Gammaproteobacteria TaxID=1236 RepID=Q5ZV90_LEGPH|nr:tRNA-(ms(2)io(6)a)-hydrolase(tRNA hydroxylase) [Legionella pneumophila subsp. pneumophila str. Philadelphia 1]AEW51753.1 tRNA-(ms(2)io(6)a)-hydrolase(tRNA hydroxylase) [Legionella pneumophila subsp. pneumophila ATCC 43290]PNL78085.1 tRNA-(ms[2]io[6]A)-hydroxylase [Legionella pneumophila subsp. pneumophila]PPK33265.1 tRNA-(ms[2]io[6]A)-hydroxylase [Legionella pneumophila]OOD05362.1 tRNA-(ms[2]io[6]A)-hydroxylase [Legionella pneumophila subsp. pneumophila ATCC 43290]